MKFSNIIKGLTGIVLAGSLSLNSMAQKRQYIPGNVHEVKYKRTTEKDFAKYKLEEQCLFDNCYNFWSYSPKANELNFSVSKIEENVNVLESGGGVTILSKRYTPKKISNKIDVMNCVTKTSLDKIRRITKSKEYFGFSADITDKDLELKLPEIKVNGVSYIVLKVEDVSEEEVIDKLPIYLIPKKKGTKITIPNQPFMHGEYVAQANIEGDIYQPFLNNPNLADFTAQLPEQNQKQSSSQNESQEEWQGNTQKTPYMKELEEQEKKEQLRNQVLQKQKKQDNALEKKVVQTPQRTLIKEEKKDSAVYHIIRKGDTYFNLADFYWGTSQEADEIEKLNPGISPDKLKIGQKIRVK